MTGDCACETAAPVAPGARAGRREWTGLAVLALPAFVIALDFSVLNLAVPVISRELMPTATGLLWIVDIYGFILAGFLVTMGTLGDGVGRRLISQFLQLVLGQSSLRAGLWMLPTMGGLIGGSLATPLFA